MRELSSLAANIKINTYLKVERYKNDFDSRNGDGSVISGVGLKVK